MIVLLFFFLLLEKEQVSEVMVARTTAREAAEERSGEVADMITSGGFYLKLRSISTWASFTVCISSLDDSPPPHIHTHTHTPSYKRSDYENTQPVAPPGVSSLR